VLDPLKVAWNAARGQQMKSMVSKVKIFTLAIPALAALLSTAGCKAKDPSSATISPGVVIEQLAMIPLQAETSKAINSAPQRMDKGAGLAGLVGGARVKLLKAGTHELLIPMPQLADSQVPVSYAIITTPTEAGSAYSFHDRGNGNMVVGVQVKGNRDQEIQIDWSAVVLTASKAAGPGPGPSEPFLKATGCAQSGAAEIAKLADKLWPASGKSDAYAASIQEFISKMKQQKPPRSLDALGILESGGNWICTANANLAAALLRAKHIPARSIAVIPPTGQRLEMHRIVEFFDQNQWLKFDPSSLHKDIPTKPWQNIIMARTSIADEEVAAQPRMGTPVGCPYGQELELPDGGLTLWGQDFFWTMGKSLAEFEASDEAVSIATKQWNEFLKSGKLAPSQIKAASAADAQTFLAALQSK
jgi:hypothetical protein